jgi:dUTP pyrophosphatase
MFTLYLYTTNSELKEKYLSSSYRSDDAGIDLYAPEDISVQEGDTIFLNHQIRCRMTREQDGVEQEVSYHLYPRSSMAKTHLRLANSVGIIDSGYRGEIIAALDAKYSDGVTKHQRLVQLCAPGLEKIRLVVVDDLDLQTERGSRGFGSTGK